VTSAHPWLQFWQATFIKYAEPGRARDLLRQVQDSLAGPDHATAQLLCLAGIIETHYLEWQDFSELPSLVRAMADRLRPELVGALDVQSDLVIHSRLVLGLMHCQPDLGPLAQGLKRTLRALPRCDSAVERLAAANVALNHFNWLDRTYMADSLIDEVDAIAMDPAMPPRLCVLWHCNVAIRRFLTHRLDEASARVALARDLASRHSLDQLVFVFQHADVNALLARGELEAARALIDRMHHSLQQHRKLDTAFLSLLEVNWACSAGDFEAAVHHAREALDVGEEHGLPVIWRAQFEATLANAHAGAGDFDAADQWYECAIHSAQGADIDTYEEHRLFTRAYGDFKGGRDSEGLKALKSALERNKARHGVAVLRHLPGAAALLADRALCHDVQVAYVHQWIERQRLSPPDLNNGQWPWPIALHALGNLALHRRGVPVVERGKAQLKPQALLALLLGAGRTGLARNRVTAQLWSDDEVTSPVKALEITVHRLRKWLGDDDAIVMHGNSIALDDNLVWSDVRALDRIYEWLDSEAARGAPTAELQRMTQHLLRMYRGPFCNGIDYPAINLIRDRCRRRFAGAADRLGLLLEARGELLSADALYTRALEVEPVAEVLYCGLMRVASARDDRASASSAYARCKQVLSVMLGMRPSVETERLAVELNMSGA
jgi:DNA-binding SARP family transcriptional activator